MICNLDDIKIKICIFIYEFILYYIFLPLIAIGARVVGEVALR